MPPSADTGPTVPVPSGASAPPDPTVASLYQDIILSHYRAPNHKGALPGAAAGVEHQNPLCGDTISMQVRVEDGKIADAAFGARACSITQATASMLLSRLIGLTVAEAAAVVAQVERLIEPGVPLTETEAESLGDLRALASVIRFPARKACVRLVTGAISGAMASQ